MNKIVEFYDKNKRAIIITSIVVFIVLLFLPICTRKTMDINSPYTSKGDVALYLMQYHELPPNYITVYGNDYLEKHPEYNDDYAIGGDTHINDGKLKGFGVTEDVMLKECDIKGESYDKDYARGSLRLVYTCNTKSVRVFYTTDHYDTFEELTSFQLQLTSNVFWIIFGVYTAIALCFYSFIFANKYKKADI